MPSPARAACRASRRPPTDRLPFIVDYRRIRQPSRADVTEHRGSEQTRLVAWYGTTGAARNNRPQDFDAPVHTEIYTTKTNLLLGPIHYFWGELLAQNQFNNYLHRISSIQWRRMVGWGLTSHSTQFRSFRRRCFYRSDDPTNSVKALKEGG